MAVDWKIPTKRIKIKRAIIIEKYGDIEKAKDAHKKALLKTIDKDFNKLAQFESDEDGFLNCFMEIMVTDEQYYMLINNKN